VDVTTAEARAVGPVPIALNDHRTPAPGTVAGKRRLHGYIHLHGAHHVRTNTRTRASRLPAGLADGFGLRGHALLGSAPRFTPALRTARVPRSLRIRQQSAGADRRWSGSSQRRIVMARTGYRRQRKAVNKAKNQRRKRGRSDRRADGRSPQMKRRLDGFPAPRDATAAAAGPRGASGRVRPTCPYARIS